MCAYTFFVRVVVLFAFVPKTESARSWNTSYQKQILRPNLRLLAVPDLPQVYNKQT